jgi:hypothetical protein
MAPLNKQDAYRHVAGEIPVRGNLVPDAHVAAILFQHGVRMIYSNDRDFQARRLGLARGKTLILDDMNELNFVNDLVVHTAPAARSRAIDRYARSAQLAPGSDEVLVLEAMRVARFAILVIERRHEAAGLVATDLFRREQVWLVDIGLEASMAKDAIIATRLYAPERFSMTGGVSVPVDLGVIQGLYAELPRSLGRHDLTTLVDDRRFAETIYRVALADGIMDRVAFQELPQNP